MNIVNLTVMSLSFAKIFKLTHVSELFVLSTSKYTETSRRLNKKAVLPQGNRAMPQVFFSVEVRQH